MASLKAMESSNPILILMRETSETANTTVRESTHGVQATFTKEITNSAKRTATEFTKTSMVHDTKVHGIKERGMERVYRSQWKVRRYNANSRME